MKDLNLLVCSDLHGSKNALKVLGSALEDEAFDAVVICGDLTSDGSVKYVRKLLDTLKARILAVPGNCDTPGIVSMLENERASIHGARAEVDGTVFYGFGGAPPSPYHMPFEIPESAIADGLRRVGSGNGVMVTHTPAYGMNDMSGVGHRMGSKAVMDVALELRPRLALSGHVHEARGEDVFQGTVFVNPGPAKEGYYAKVLLSRNVRVSLCRT